MDSCMEDHSHKATTDAFHHFFEDIEDFLECYEEEEPALPQTQLFAPLAGAEAPQGHGRLLDLLLEELPIPGPPDCQAAGRPQEPSQKAVSAPDLLASGPRFRETPAPQGPAGPQQPSKDQDREPEQLPGQAMRAPSWLQTGSCSAHGTPAAASQGLPATNGLKAPGASHRLPEDPAETSAAGPTHRGIHMPLSAAQIIDGLQGSFPGAQSLLGIPMRPEMDLCVGSNARPFTAGQTPPGCTPPSAGHQPQSARPMAFPAQQKENEGQVTLRVETFVDQGASLRDSGQEPSTDVFQELCWPTWQAQDPAAPESELRGPVSGQGAGSRGEAPAHGQDVLAWLCQELLIPGCVPVQAACGLDGPRQEHANGLVAQAGGAPGWQSLIAQGQDSPQAPCEPKASAPPQLPGPGTGMPCWEQNMSCSAQSNSMAASHMTADTGVLKAFCGDQALAAGAAKAPAGPQPLCADHTPHAASQIIAGVQVPSSFAPVLWGNRVAFAGQGTPTVSASPTGLTGPQPANGSQAPRSMQQQAFSGHQAPLTGAQVLWVSQVPLSAMAGFGGHQVPLSANQTPPGVQTTPGTGLPTMTFMAGQTSSGTQPVTPRDTQSPWAIQMVPPILPLPQAGFVAASGPWPQGQPPEPHTPRQAQGSSYQTKAAGQKCYACSFQGCGKEYSKASHLRIHERVHTGDKPYVCDVQGCTWRFPRSDELSRHKKRHTGERPYHCPQCHKAFARRDHVKQHARVHR